MVLFLALSSSWLWDRFGQRSIAVNDRARTLEAFLPLAGAIEGFWRDPENRSAPAWEDHRGINRVMLAASLIPDGYLGA